MKKLLAIALVAGAAIAASAPADAAQGCGPGGHRGPYGHCRPNYGPGRGGPVLVVGNYYHGHGYWDGHRYYQHRDHRGDGYRYY